MWLTSEAKALSSDGRIISAIQYATQSSIYPPQSTAGEFTTAQAIIISFLYALKQRDLELIKTLVKVSSEVPQIKSSFLSVWLRDDFSFPRGDVATCLSNLGKLLLDGLQLPWTLAATIASLDVKYCIQECFVEADDTAGQILLSMMNTCISKGTQVDFAKDTSNCGTQSEILEKTSTGTQAGLIAHDRGTSVKPEQSTTGVQTTPQSANDPELWAVTGNLLQTTPTACGNVFQTSMYRYPPGILATFQARSKPLRTTPNYFSVSNPIAQATPQASFRPFLPLQPANPAFTSRGNPFNYKDSSGRITTRVEATPEPGNGPELRAGTAIGPQTTVYGSLPTPSRNPRTCLPVIDPSTGKDVFDDCLSPKTVFFKRDPAVSPKPTSSCSSACSANSLEEVTLSSSTSSTVTNEQIVKVEDGTKNLIDTTGLVSNKQRPISKGMANELLYNAIQKDDAKALVTAINNGADVEDEGVMMKRPLHVAASAGRVEPAIELIHWGANVDSLDNWGETPLFVASVAGHTLIVEVLVAAGADINHRNSEGNSPLHVAATAGWLKVVAILLGGGAEVDSRGQSSRTPLHCAAAGGHISVVGLLLDHGADPTAVEWSGHTPHSLAKSNQQNLVAEFLYYRLRQ